MHLNVEQLNVLRNGSIYFEECGTLAQRIDFAWNVYLDTDDYKEDALKFLIYAFDLSETEDINTQLMVLMSERQQYQDKNPDYIPSKKPNHLSLDPSKLNLQMVGDDVPEDIQQAIQSRELLDMKNMHKYIIDPKHTKYLDAEERAYYRVNIRKGLFEQDRQPFSTLSMESHGRLEYAAYTINANGELSVFPHLGGADGLYHSSMNAGAPVVSAGELKINDGVLVAITTSSGHYNPSLFNVHRTLEYFASHHVDISEVNVLTHFNPSKSIKNITSSAINPGYSTPATQIYKGVKEIMSEAIANMEGDLKKFNEDPLTTLFGFFTSQRTHDRIRLAKDFQSEIKAYTKSLQGCSPNQLFEIKLPELTRIINKYQDKNTALSQKYQEKYFGSRLTRTIANFKQRIDDLKDESELKTSKTEPLATKMKKLY
ncbi:MAG: hypothetical protein P1U74_04545 [Legionellaceae bacterium]|nr:hypothetical protein [Legionellaceae bacterium]